MYKTRIASDYFTIQGLETRTGLSSEYWEYAIIKEITDNALDAVEPSPTKEIAIDYYYRTLKIFDNGPGFSVADVQAIYDFENYVSKNRHVINISRGKQGNGLKTIIGICQQRGYRLIWHTNEGKAVSILLDTNNAQDGEISVTLDEGNVKPTDRRGIEIQGFRFKASTLKAWIGMFAECNRDVRFTYSSFSDDEDDNEIHEPTAEPVDRQGETSLLFYTFPEYKRLLSVQDGDRYYKDFLGELFGTRMKNASRIKGKISGLNIGDVESDFWRLQEVQNKKPLTLLKKHLIVYPNVVEQLNPPYIIEYEAHKSDSPGATVMINNSITYHGGESVEMPGFYRTKGDREKYHGNLGEIARAFGDYRFYVHIITPRPSFTDSGKTTMTLDKEAAKSLVDSMRKAVNRERKTASREIIRPLSKKALAFKNMDTAYRMASSGGKYNITARQMYYKLRELIADETWETGTSTYNTFTQDWLTQWLDDHPEHESKVHFSDRGVFIVDKKSVGIGSANVQDFLYNERSRQNHFTLNAEIELRLEHDYDVSYRYDKVLYVEKTGFNSLFLAEGIPDKYNMIIVSGQGYGSRSARKLLHELQQKGLEIYCMHDLDVYGVGILESLRTANDKFKHDIDVIDLGVTPEDVAYYEIIPEKVKLEYERLYEMKPHHQNFFEISNGYSRRVELNAFTTEQLLEIIDDKLKDKKSLPKLDLSDAIKFNEQKLKDYALFQLVRKQHEKMLSRITIDGPDLLSDEITYHEMMQRMPSIEEQLINELSAKIEKELEKKEATA